MTADEISEYVELAMKSLDELTKLSRAMWQRADKDHLILYKSITYHINHLTDDVRKLLNSLVEEAEEQENDEKESGKEDDEE